MHQQTSISILPRLSEFILICWGNRRARRSYNAGENNHPSAREEVMFFLTDLHSIHSLACCALHEQPLTEPQRLFPRCTAFRPFVMFPEPFNFRSANYLSCLLTEVSYTGGYLNRRPVPINPSGSRLVTSIHSIPRTGVASRAVATRVRLKRTSPHGQRISSCGYRRGC